jgi:NAD+ diphosphatase
MRHAETVTFGGSGFNRAADFRGDAGFQARLLADPASRVLPVWRGKPLITGADEVALAFLSPGHGVFADASEGPIFLGMEDGIGYFAHDMSAWDAAGADLSRVGQFVDESEHAHPLLDGGERFAELRRNMTRLTPRDAELAAMAVGLFAWHRNHGFCARCGAKSDISHAGWQRTCPACGFHHFPRTDPVVIMLITRGDKVLIGRSHGWPDGMYSLLAGFMEPGETIEAAVRREVFEETAIRVGAVDYLASQPWPFPSSLMIGCKGEALSDEITVDTTEIEDAKWVTREEIMEAWATRSSTLIAARKGAIAHFLIKNWLSDSLI